MSINGEPVVNAVRHGLQIVGALSHVRGWSPIEGHGKAVWAVPRNP